MAPIIDYLKKSKFTWSNTTSKVFVEIKIKWSDPSICLPDFSKIFKAACDESGIW